MPVSPARAAAFDILLKLEREDSYASELLHSQRLSQLSASDRALATELVMGVLRWQSLLDRGLSSASTQQLGRLDPEVLLALRLGIYQLQFLSRIPPRAAIFESVEMVKAARKRSASGFVNAVLRKTARGNSATALREIENCANASHLAMAAAHPEWLVARWVDHYGLAAARAICRHNQTVPPTTIHMDDGPTSKEIGDAGVRLSPGPLLASAHVVTEGDVTKTKAYQEGRIAIQDEASQLVARLIGHGNRILDCCAAPGSKTSLLAKNNPGAEVLASDLHPHRARLLRTLTRQQNVHVIAADARQLPFASDFDRILADVPCSGTGTLSRHPEIKWRLKPEDLSDLQARQTAILSSALTRLAPAGRLVYSTCSLEREENERVVETALAGKTEFEIVDCRDELNRLRSSGELSWADVDPLLAGPYLRTIPGLHPCDGFFAAVIERRAGSAV
jgi:16S rRNA (cytosine967-C5)-methyltransferase